MIANILSRFLHITFHLICHQICLVQTINLWIFFFFFKLGVVLTNGWPNALVCVHLMPFVPGCSQECALQSLSLCILNCSFNISLSYIFLVSHFLSDLLFNAHALKRSFFFNQLHMVSNSLWCSFVFIVDSKLIIHLTILIPKEYWIHILLYV